MEDAGANGASDRDRGEGRDAADFGGFSDRDIDIAAEAAGLGIGGGFGGPAGRSDYTNRAERADLANYGGTQFSGLPGEPLGDFATYSSPQGLLGMFGQWGPFASNPYGSWSNISPTNVARDVGVLGGIGMNALAGNLPGAALGLAGGLRGLMARNEGAVPGPGGYGGQSFDPSAGARSAEATRGEGRGEAMAGLPGGYEAALRRLHASLYDNPDLQRLQRPPDSYARRVFSAGPTEIQGAGLPVMPALRRA